MKSRITIEVDYDNGNRPIIQILHVESPDVRDGLIKSFLQSFGGQSSWCKIQFSGTNESYNGRMVITPITNTELEEQSRLMAAVNKEYEFSSRNVGKE